MIQDLKKVYKFKYTILSLGISELKLKYTGSILGFFWSILEPLSIILIYSLIFPLILKVNFLEWVLFFLCGLIPYRYLRKGILDLTTSLVERRDILLKATLPTEIIPLSRLFSNSVSFFLESLVISLFILIFVKPSPYLLAFPLLFIIQLFFICGMGLFFSVYYPRFRDLNYILNIVFEAFFFLTPVVYRIDFIPLSYRKFYLLNPLARLIFLWQVSWLGKPSSELPFLKNLILLFLFSLLILLGGYWFFLRKKEKVIEEV